MEATILKNFKWPSRKDHKPIAAKEVKSRREVTTVGGAYVSQPTESSGSLGSLTYVSSKGFFFQ